MEPKTTLSICFLLTGISFIGISIPLILQKIPPNQWYGWRTKKSLSNKEIWYEINRYGGKDLFAAGLVASVGALVLLIFRTELSESAISCSGLVLLLVPLAIVVFRGFRYERKL